MSKSRVRRDDVSPVNVSHPGGSDVSGRRRKQVSVDAYASVAPIASEADPWETAVLRYEREEVTAGKRPRTVTLDRENLRVTAKLLAAERLLVDPYRLTRDHLLTIIARMRAPGRQAQTINIRLQVWRKFFGYLHRSGAIPGDPVVGLRKLPEARRQPRAISDD